MLNFIVAIATAVVGFLLPATVKSVPPLWGWSILTGAGIIMILGLLPGTHRPSGAVIYLTAFGVAVLTAAAFLQFGQAKSIHASEPSSRAAEAVVAVEGARREPEQDVAPKPVAVSARASHQRIEPERTSAPTPADVARDDSLKVDRMRQLTALYVYSHDGISPAMVAGLELPPVDWLNAELAKLGESWRVTSTQADRFEWRAVSEGEAASPSSASKDPAPPQDH